MSILKFHYFTGKRSGGADPEHPLKDLPAPPPWRQFGKEAAEFVLDPGEAKDSPSTRRERDLAESYEIGGQTEIVDAVNAALILRRPLLVTGPPGTGKSSLIYAVARELRLGPVLTWSITSRSTLREGLYDYDALGRLQEIQIQHNLERNDPEKARTNPQQTSTRVADFLRLGPLGTALLPAKWPKALLIDEIDKADLDLPNDLLNIFEEGKFTIEELRRDASGVAAPVRTWRDHYAAQALPGGEVACTVFPFILLTSNGEREFSAPFLRRCVRLDIKLPDDKALAKVVRAHFERTAVKVEEEAAEFLKKRAERKLSTDQLMNAVFLLEQYRFGTDDKKRVLEILYRDLR